MINVAAESATPIGRIVTIQWLRGIAALLVVFHHSFRHEDWVYVPILNGLRFGAGGVDIFFVISGCVMYIAARHERPLEFAYKRLLRIVPLYWLITLTFVAMRFSHWGSTEINGATLAKSLLFVPYRAVTGHIWPILVPGWTLNVEMFFYLLFCIGLCMPRPALTSGLLVTLCVIVGLLTNPMHAALSLYTSPILIEFVAGLALGNLFLTKRHPIWLWPLLPLGVLLLLGSDLLEPSTPVVRGVAGILIVAGALSLEARRKLPRIPALELLGDASYALYLVHPLFLHVLHQAFHHVRLTGWVHFLVFTGVALIGSIAIAIVMHRLVERPLLRFVHHRGRSCNPVLMGLGSA